MRIGESLFCIFYLCFAAYAAFTFSSKGNTLSSLCAIMALLLGGGDGFHLIPRVIIDLKGETADEEENRKRTFYLGLGNIVSSITMTLFYVYFYRVMELRTRTKVPSILFIILVMLTFIRIGLCLFPQNDWFKGSNLKWGIIRNIPFVIIGLIVVYILVAYHKSYLLAALVTVSFVCYMLVVLYARKKPAIGMMMIPKTICYIWIIAILLG